MIKKFIINTSLISFFSFLIILTIEVLLYFANFPLYDDRTFNNTHVVTFAGGSKHKPNVKNTTRLGYPSLSTDSTGLVHNGILRTNEDLHNAVFVLGGSTVEGWGASSNKKTIPAQLEICLNKNLLKPIVVANAGFQGDYSYQEFQRALDFIGRYNPKMIVVLDGRNDGHFGMLKSWTAFDSNPGIHGPLKYINEAGHRGRGDQIIHDMRSISRLINIAFLIKKKSIKKNNLEKFNFDNDMNDQKITLIVNSYLTTHKILHEVGKSFNIPVFSFLQPSLEAKDNLTVQEKNNLEKFRKRMKWPKNYYTEISNFYKEVILNLPKEIINISKIFNDIDEKVYVDSVHYNDKGNFIISNEICRQLLSL
jgi:hypothetical protein